MASETDTETEAEAQRLYQRGRFYLDCGLPEDALKPLTQVTELVPGSPRRGKKQSFVTPPPSPDRATGRRRRRRRAD
ncbi:MAG: hypothetical protein VW268_01775 [Rhodospirillaceae bacterium]